MSLVSCPFCGEVEEDDKMICEICELPIVHGDEHSIGDDTICGLCDPADLEDGDEQEN